MLFLRLTLLCCGGLYVEANTKTTPMAFGHWPSEPILSHRCFQAEMLLTTFIQIVVLSKLPRKCLDIKARELADMSSERDNVTASNSCGNREQDLKTFDHMLLSFFLPKPKEGGIWL